METGTRSGVEIKSTWGIVDGVVTRAVACPWCVADQLGEEPPVVPFGYAGTDRFGDGTHLDLCAKHADDWHEAMSYLPIDDGAWTL